MEVAVPVGYKKTAIGVIPSDWSVDEIQDHAEITTGSKNTDDNVEDGRYPFFVRSQQIERINTYSFDGEAVLTAGDGVGTGKVFHYFKGKFDYHQRVYKISNFDEKLDGYFFYLYFSTHFLRRIMTLTAKSSVDSIRRDAIAKMLIPLPARVEQTRIAEVVRDTTELIEVLDNVIEKKRRIKRGATQNLVSGIRRLPGFNEKWAKKELIDILEYEQPTDYIVEKASYDDNAKTPVLTAGKTFILGFTDEETGIFRALPVIIFDDFTTASKYVTFPFKVKSSAAKMLKPRRTETNLKFVYERMQLIHFPIGDHKRYWISEYQHLPIDIPEPKEQAAIAKVLSDADAEIDALGKIREKYIEIKQGMMQQLLTGRIRLP
jgi:type I restriction enzyme, S subunit